MLTKIVVDVDSNLRNDFRSKVRMTTKSSMTEIIRGFIERYCNEDDGLREHRENKRKMSKFTILLDDNLKVKFKRITKERRDKVHSLVVSWMKDFCEEEKDEDFNHVVGG